MTPRPAPEAARPQPAPVGPEVKDALRVIREAAPDAILRRRSADRYEIVQALGEEGTRRTFASRLALLHVARRARAHLDWLESAHFWELWGRSNRFVI